MLETEAGKSALALKKAGAGLSEEVEKFFRYQKSELMNCIKGLTIIEKKDSRALESGLETVEKTSIQQEIDVIHGFLAGQPVLREFAECSLEFQELMLRFVRIWTRDDRK